MRNKKPWLNPDGTLKSDEEIKLSSKNWSPSVWESYLKTLEVDQEELLLDDPTFIEEHSQEEHHTHSQNLPSLMELPALRKYLFKAVEELTPKQQEVLSYLFLEDLSLRGAGKKMGISAVAVIRIRDRALKSLGQIFVDRVTSKIPTTKTRERTRAKEERREREMCL